MVQVAEILNEGKNLLQTLPVLFLVAGITLLVVYKYVIRASAEDKSMPPGPRGLPIVGVLPWAAYHHIYVYVWKIAHKYGKIVKIPMGRLNIFFINDYEWSKEFSMHPEFQGRNKDDFFHEFTEGLGVVNSEGSLWKHQRRFTVHALKDGGMGKLKMQDKIIEELNQVVAEINKAGQTPQSLKEVLEKSTCNIICKLAFDKQYDFDDPNLIRLLNIMNTNFRLIAFMQMFSAFPWLYAVAKVFIYKKMEDNTEEFKREAQKFIDEHKVNLDPNNPRDLIDLYLMEMSRESVDEGDKEYLDSFFEEQLVRVILDLFGAGTETSSTTIRWAILYMLHNPEVQRRVQQELDDVVGTERLPMIEDRQMLPYTVATLQEVERLACVAPASLPRSNPKAAEFHGYKFKARQYFHFNIFSIHRDPKIWKDPEVFKPERFINDDGKVFRPPQLLPFGSGRRACPGEGLAKVEIFLYFATLLHRYEFRALDPNNLPSLDARFSFVRGPHDYKVKCIKRHAG